MESLALTTSSPNLEAGGGHSGMTRWIGGLPPELWVDIMRHLCPHCYLDPPLKSGVVFEPFVGERPELLPTGYSHDLQSMTMTCKGFRYLAQIYVFHCFDSKIREDFEIFRTHINRRLDLARAVRDMTVSSDLLHRCILTRLGNIDTLNFRIHNFRISRALRVASSKRTLVGSLKYLKHLTITLVDDGVVDIAKGRLWLENLMHAAPGLERLRCHRFTDFSCNPHGGDLTFPAAGNASLNYARLPENKLLGLELLSTWFRFDSLRQLLRNFKNLREFRHSRTEYVEFGANHVFDDETMRPVDGHDVITLLKPLQQQLEVLDLDFRHYPEYQNGLSPFRPIGSLAKFTALKTVRLCQKSIGEPPGLYSDNASDTTDTDEEGEHIDSVIAATKGFFVKHLSFKSLEFLQIDDFDDWFGVAVIELAQHAARGELPRLKHVRLLGVNECRLDQVHSLNYQLDRYHDLESLVPERYRGVATIRRAVVWEDHARKAEDLFRGAGVLFERVELSWYVREETEVGYRRMYPQPCVEGRAHVANPTVP